MIGEIGSGEIMIMRRFPARSRVGAWLAAAALVFVSGTAAAQSAASVEASLDSVLARVRVLEDREEIRALLLAYGRALDARDFVAFADLFAEQDGEWVGGFGSAKGRQAIFALMDEMIGHNAPIVGAGSYHVFSNEQIEIDGDRAAATTKWTFVMAGDDGNPRWVYLGHYDDTFVRENGRWRFLRREAFTDLPAQE